MARHPGSRSAPYKRGALDPLLDEHNRTALPLTGVSFELSGSGMSLICTCNTAGGTQPRRVLVEYPAYFDIKLPDGREIQIEVREFVVEAPPAVQVPLMLRFIGEGGGNG